jgi:hypothetical protein
MTDWQRIANHFNQSARCRRSKDARPQVAHEPGCTFIECQHEKCACRTNAHGDEPLSMTLQKWQEAHGQSHF